MDFKFTLISCILPSELYVGSAPSDQRTLEELKKIGVNAILDLTEKEDGYKPTTEIKNSVTTNVPRRGDVD